MRAVMDEVVMDRDPAGSTLILRKHRKHRAEAEA
jgi:hypothetical protein